MLATDFIIVHFKDREGSELSEAVTRRAGVPEGSNTWQALVYSGTSYFLHSSNHRRCCNEFRSKDWAVPPRQSLMWLMCYQWKILSSLPRARGRESPKFDSFQLPLPSRTMSPYCQIYPRGDTVSRRIGLYINFVESRSFKNQNAMNGLEANRMKLRRYQMLKDWTVSTPAVLFMLRIECIRMHHMQWF